MKFYYIPYFQNDGTWTFSDTFILNIYEKMKQAGVEKTVFHNGSIRHPREFLYKMKRNDHAVTIVANDNKECVAVAWLNGFEGRSAWGHFCMFPAIWGKHTVEVGKEILRTWFKPGYIDVIQGRVDSSNLKAVAFLSLIGMKILGTIPDGVQDIYTGKQSGAVIAYVHKDFMGE